jgi:hypothetical protein
MEILLSYMGYLYFMFELLLLLLLLYIYYICDIENKNKLWIYKCIIILINIIRKNYYILYFNLSIIINYLLI